MIDFSIITISFNQAKYLERCITSIINQQGAKFEYIVVDPGSTDHSRDIIAAHSHQIKCVVTDKDKGPADGLNNGIKQSTGKYLIYINADDFLLPGALRKIASILKSKSHPDILLCGGWLVDSQDTPIRRLFTTRFTNKGLVNHGASLFQQGMVFKKELYEKAGGFNPDNHTCCDYELLVDLIKIGADSVINSTRVAAFRMHNESISSGFHGEEQDLKFHNDLNRIHNKLFPSGQHISPKALGYFRRFEKYIRTPEIIPFILHDKIMKKRTLKAWENDLMFLKLSL